MSKSTLTYPLSAKRRFDSETHKQLDEWTLSIERREMQLAQDRRALLHYSSMPLDTANSGFISLNLKIVGGRSELHEIEKMQRGFAKTVGYHGSAHPSTGVQCKEGPKQP